jgi:hypothetical protein
MNDVVAWAVIGQALFAGAVLVVTIWYARTTKHLLEVQVEPDLDCLLMPVEADSDDMAFTIRNNTVCSLSRVTVTISLPEQLGAGPNDPDVFRVLERLSLGGLGSEASIDMRFEGGFVKGRTNQNHSRHADKAKFQFFTQVLVQITCQRRVDAREFFYTYRYRILEGPEVAAMMQTHKQRMVSARRIILRKIGEQKASGDSDIFLEPKPSIDSSV